MPNQMLVDQYLRAIAKRALPIFQSNNFQYTRRDCISRVPSEDELYEVLKELHKTVLKRAKKLKRLSSKQSSLGRFTMFFAPERKLGIRVLLDVGEHDWTWNPEKVFKEQIQPIQEEELCQKTN